ncbi:MAG TPA: acyl-CoA carboxylase subunit epsilon [Mycobacteriales bacterium]
MTAAGPDSEPRPLLRVVRGTPDDAELAALTAVVLTLTAGGTDTPPPTRSLWRDRGALVHARLVAGRGAWRASGLPR